MLETIYNFLFNQTPLLYLNQSLWRDEAFSVLMSEPSLKEIIRLTASDFNPPLYYFILHFWMKIFGATEISIRIPSLIFHLLLIYTSYKLAQKFFKSEKVVIFCLLLIAFNPMLLYYAFEARMYSLLALLATVSMYFFYTEQWSLYILVSALGLWTQPFMFFIIFSQIAYLFVSRKLKKIHLRYFLTILLLFLPWLPAILFQFSHSGPMWIWKINWTTVTTILGNLFTGYEGTPGNLWDKMKFLSIIIFGAGFWIARIILRKEPKKQTINRFALLLLLWLFLPITLVLTISYFKPIYVNRYLIFTSVAEVFLLVTGISLIKNKSLQTAFFLLLLFFCLAFNSWFPPTHKKLDLRLAVKEIQNLATSKNLVFAQTPLTFFETTYYFPDRSRVFLYNPYQSEIPFYVGKSLIPKEGISYSPPTYPNRAFVIHDDGTYEVISKR